ncbi:hypothetical protein HBHAL_2472 [Halobacillus halophilus DSM 2266]|uniref:Uncharacterized protein n=1 Tax=Halobacillus halophilus (strain ATCC 35676 / DSM 2266 / JCM 20832 / KCTC 3685 / LMG 17431 / NBRC 102448 / NCIMB 2269) TaxID=866895 RepID=I0JKZ5_HALH3|nr:hypothetical protein HBHAL_2472 [Halobacillus halophilus DSM 2266]
MLFNQYHYFIMPIYLSEVGEKKTSTPGNGF